MGDNDIGLVGLAAMGRNLALNIEGRGSSVAVYNRTPARTRDFVEGPGAGRRFTAAYSAKDLIEALTRPRKVILMVKAGPPVDAMIDELASLMEPGDLIVDGGNAWFEDTERRFRKLETGAVHFIGAGISGGEEGALRGPSIMPGGSREAYGLIEPLLVAIAADVDGEPCVTYIGPRGAGHYVKMVHNGIEYGEMQLIAEAYDVMRRGLGLQASELHEIFERWSRGELSSYLMEITAEIFAKEDDETGRPLVDLIADEAQQKGTGRWTSQSALDLGVPVPTIDAAVASRVISAGRGNRNRISQAHPGEPADYAGDRERLVEALGSALHAAKICSHAQGMALLRAASAEYGYGLNPAEIARIWRGGCIIRGRILDRIRAAFEIDPDLPNLLLDSALGRTLADCQADWRFVIQAAVGLGIPCPALGVSLAYFDACRSARLPANLIQAQRDYFGAHTYRRFDKEGTLHTEWK
jgi:6-phosphogluconate dehydrogenase